MPHWCEFCQTTHSSMSCYHPGRRFMHPNDVRAAEGRYDSTIIPDKLVEPTMEVVLDDMPEGWVLFAIGEEKPCMAPPAVSEEIRLLKLNYANALDALQRIAEARELGWMTAEDCEEVAQMTLDCIQVVNAQ